MRKILAIGLATYLLSSCNPNNQPLMHQCKEDSLNTYIEKIRVECNSSSYMLDSLSNSNLELSISNKELKDKLFDSNYKIEKVRNYLKIVDKNPTQIKFLKGWCYRAIK